jgi:hypothetical protein
MSFPPRPSFLSLDAKTSYRQKIDDGVDLLAILTEQYKRKAIIENNPFILVVFGDEARDVIYRSSTARALELSAELFRRGILAVTRSLTMCDCFGITYGRVIENLCHKITESRHFGVATPDELEFVHRINTTCTQLPRQKQMGVLRSAVVTGLWEASGCKNGGPLESSTVDPPPPGPGHGNHDDSIFSRLLDQYVIPVLEETDLENLEDEDYESLSNLVDVPIVATAADYADNVEISCEVDDQTICIICTGLHDSDKHNRSLNELVVRTKCCGKFFHDKCLRHAVCYVGPPKCPMCRHDFRSCVDGPPIPETPPGTPPGTPPRAPLEIRRFIEGLSLGEIQ